MDHCKFIIESTTTEGVHTLRCSVCNTVREATVLPYFRQCDRQSGKATTTRFTGFGPGSQLGFLIVKFFKKREGCNCEEHLKQMDRWGCKGCEENREVILGWLKEELAIRKLPYNRMIANRAITIAIKRAKKSGACP